MAKAKMRILLVEDDKAVRITVRDALEEAGYKVVEYADGPSALAAIERESFDLLLTDIRLPGMDGISLFRHLRSAQPDCPAILMTAYGRVEDAVNVIQEGAHDYITKPFDIDELLLRIDRLEDELYFRQVLEEGLPEGCDAPESGTRQISGSSPSIQQVRKRIEAAAQAGVNVLITGETGTGKELCVRTLHCQSARSSKPLVHVNCAAIPSELLEAEMFGHERGAFTGALRRREGRMAAANGGTLFMDEVGELNLEHQAKLLRAIELGTFEPVGSNQPIKVDLWLISATNIDLRESVKEQTFRQDLYFRLNVIEIDRPPLRERRGDIPVLVSDFLREAATRRNEPMPGLSPSATAALMTYDYPGNIRELFHALEHGLALSRGKEIELEHLPASFQVHTPSQLDSGQRHLSLTDAVRHFEREYIQRVLDRADGKRGEAAKILGISRKSLWQKLKED
jgi:DNA-binding NtrC family response regulator